jgi:hypothetical protein
LRDGEVVNSRQVKHAGRLLLDQIEIRSSQRQAALAYVSRNDLKVSNILSAELCDSRTLFYCTRCQRRLHQQDKAAVVARKPFQQAICDEAGKSGYE